MYSFRCLDAFCIYGSDGKVEEPYVTITRKKQMPREGQTEEVEQEVGQAEGKLVTHRAAFARTSVIQAFLGSAPQLTLQLYICVLQKGVSIGRGENTHTHTHTKQYQVHSGTPKIERCRRQTKLIKAFRETESLVQ